MRERKTSEIVSYSPDGITMFVAVQRATDKYLTFLLSALVGLIQYSELDIPLLMEKNLQLIQKQ